MKSESFVYWLQGFFELSEAKTLDERQVDLIKRHLAMVFAHEIDPSFPKEQQQELSEIHNTDKLKDSIEKFVRDYPPQVGKTKDSWIRTDIPSYPGSGDVIYQC